MSLILVVDLVGDVQILVRSNGGEEIAWIGKSIGSYKHLSMYVARSDAI
jgi:hypothetical protein